MSLIGNSLIGMVDVKVTSAELLALFTTPKIIVPAPGDNRFVVPFLASCYFVPGNAAYLDPNVTDFYWGSQNGPNTSILGTYFGVGGSLFTAADPVLAPLGYPLSAGDPVLFLNTPLVLATPTANMTAGNGYLRVRMLYAEYGIP